MSGISGIVFRTEQRRIQKQHLFSMLQTEEMPSATEPPVVGIYGWSGLGVLGYAGRISGIGERSINGKIVALAFYGNILNQQECQERAESFSNLPDSLLDLYLKEGQAFLKRLRGEFVIAVSDESRGLFFIATDRFVFIQCMYIKIMRNWSFLQVARGVSVPTGS